MLSLVDAVDLLLEFFATIRQLNLDIIDIFWYTLNIEDIIGGIDRAIGGFFSPVMNDVLMISNDFL